MPDLFPVPTDADGPAMPAGPFTGTDEALGLTLPHIFVRPASGDPYTVQAYNPDMLAFEDTAAKHKWRGPADAPFRWLTFLAWSAGKRDGRHSQSWDEFRASTLEIKTVGDDTAHPTRPGLVPG